MTWVIPTPTVETKLKALLEGHRGPRVWDYEAWRSNRNGDLLDRLDTVETSEVTVNNSRTHTWEAGMNLRETPELDIFHDYVKLIVRLYDGIDDYWHEFPFGLYSFREPKGVDASWYSSWDLTGYSLEQLLLDDMATAGFKATAGQGVLETVRDILEQRYGISPTRIIFPAADINLASSIFFTPWQDANSADYLSICNTILAAGGYYALWTDGEGNFRTSRVGDAADGATAVTYGTTSAADALITNEINWEHSAENFGNVYTVYAGDADISPPVVGTAELHRTAVTPPNSWTAIVVDPDSEFSIEALGYRKQAEPEMLENIVSEAIAKDLAARRVKIAASNEKKATLTTVFDPRRGPRENYLMRVAREDGTRVHWYPVRVEGWSASLNRESPGTRHELSRFVGG